jgi:hypothetical protein
MGLFSLFLKQVCDFGNSFWPFGLIQKPGFFYFLSDQIQPISGIGRRDYDHAIS